MTLDAVYFAPYVDRKNLMFSPKEQPEQKGISLTNVLLDATHETISNVSFKPVTLYHGTTLGMVAADICLIENTTTNTDNTFIVKQKSKNELVRKLF